MIDKDKLIQRYNELIEIYLRDYRLTRDSFYDGIALGLRIAIREIEESEQYVDRKEWIDDLEDFDDLEKVKIRIEY